jgi:hypothetical protein
VCDTDNNVNAMTEPVTAAAPAAAEEVVPAKGAEQTIAEIIGSPDPKPEPKVVPEAVFLELKNDNKALKNELKELRTQVQGGATDKQVSASVSAIAEKYEVDPKFLGELAQAIRTEVDAEAEGKISARMKPIEDEKRAEKIEKVFGTHFNKAMDDMEEYKDIVNKDAIFKLSLNPANASKTIPQLIEETYGNAVSGKRSIETTSPHRGSAPGVLDMDRADRDPAYLAEALKDPALKKQYDDQVMEIARRS